MDKYVTCLEQLRRKFDPLKMFWISLRGISPFMHGVKTSDPLTNTALMLSNFNKGLEFGPHADIRENRCS